MPFGCRSLKPPGSVCEPTVATVTVTSTGSNGAEGWAGTVPVIRVGVTELRVAGTPSKVTEVVASVPKPTPPITKVWPPVAGARHGVTSCTTSPVAERSSGNSTFTCCDPSDIARIAPPGPTSTSSAPVKVVMSETLSTERPSSESSIRLRNPPHFWARRSPRIWLWKVCARYSTRPSIDDCSVVSACVKTPGSSGTETSW